MADPQKAVAGMAGARRQMRAHLWLRFLAVLVTVGAVLVHARGLRTLSENRQ